MDDVLGRIIQYIINPAMAVVFAAGLFMFMWGLVEFLWGLDESNHNEGKDHMLYGIIGMVIMVSVWGIIGLIVSTLQLEGGTATQVNPSSLPGFR